MPHGPLNIKRSTGDAALRSHFIRRCAVWATVRAPAALLRLRPGKLSRERTA